MCACISEPARVCGCGCGCVCQGGVWVCGCESGSCVGAGAAGVYVCVRVVWCVYVWVCIVASGLSGGWRAGGRTGAWIDDTHTYLIFIFIGCVMRTHRRLGGPLVAIRGGVEGRTPSSDGEGTVPVEATGSQLLKTGVAIKAIDNMEGVTNLEQLS